jgi:plasmid stabilization system protein ParE
MTRVEFHPEAEEEMREAARWYETQSAGLGQAFLDAVDAAAARIAANPEAFGFAGPGIRRHLVRRFPFGILYQVEPDRIYILAIAHGRRKPNYWRDRLEDQ